MKSVLFIYPHQLYAAEHLPDVDAVYVIEEPLLFGTDEQFPHRFHKQKLVLHLSALRRYVENVLWPKGLAVEYFGVVDTTWTGQPILKAIEQGFGRICVFDLTDHVLEQRLYEIVKDQGNKLEIEVLPTPGFYLQRSDIEQFFGTKKVYRLEDFYQWQRERFNILIEEYKPAGGRWTFDGESTQKLEDNVQLPGIPAFGDNKYVREAIKFVEEHFAGNPGSCKDFIWPTTHDEAKAWLDNFLEHRFLQFGPYQDALSPRGVWLFHSTVSSSLNCGLLTPQEVVDAALESARKNSVPMSSLEAFIHKILGWREYCRAIYLQESVALRTSNTFKNERKLTAAWYDGTTGLEPLDDVIKKVQTHAYAHHTERLMVVGNSMLLSEIHPDEVYRWFMEMFIDAYDWVVVPNVYGVSQFTAGPNIVPKPLISASNFVLDNSSYARGQWSDVWDGLYWRFIDKHRNFFGSNPRLGGVLVKRLDSMDPARRRIIGYRAEDFLSNRTHIE